MLNQILILLLGLGIGLGIGFIIGWFLYIRTRSGKVSADEYERISRLGTRRVFAEVAPPFSEIIVGISPSFCKIYNQAHDAEIYKLDQVCGLAYGKALEFLIKDFAKAEHPDKAEQIERIPLTQCLKNYIDDEYIKNSGELAIWLRNDEAHYVRKYADKDVKDLKRLIASTVKLIENSIERQVIDADSERIRQSLSSGRTAT